MSQRETCEQSDCINTESSSSPTASAIGIDGMSGLIDRPIEVTFERTDGSGTGQDSCLDTGMDGENLPAGDGEVVAQGWGGRVIPTPSWLLARFDKGNGAAGGLGDGGVSSEFGGLTQGEGSDSVIVKIAWASGDIGANATTRILVIE